MLCYLQRVQALHYGRSLFFEYSHLSLAEWEVPHADHQAAGPDWKKWFWRMRRRLHLLWRGRSYFCDVSKTEDTYLTFNCVFVWPVGTLFTALPLWVGVELVLRPGCKEQRCSSIRPLCALLIIWKSCSFSAGEACWSDFKDNIWDDLQFSQHFLKIIICMTFHLLFRFGTVYLRRPIRHIRIMMIFALRRRGGPTDGGSTSLFVHPWTLWGGKMHCGDFFSFMLNLKKK